MSIETKPAKQTRKRAQVAAAAAPVVTQVNPDGASIRTSMGAIADEARTQVTKSPIPEGGLDARMQGNNVANRVIATVRQDSRGVWRRFALEVISLTTDGRVQFLKALREWLNEVRKHEREQTANTDKEGKPDPTKEERKQAAARVNSATVEVSKLMTVAEAWNGQATEPGLLAYVNDATGKGYQCAEDVPYERIVEYARTFKKAAAGRKPDPFVLRIAKALEVTKPRTGDGEPDGEDDVKLHEGMLALLHAHLTAHPAAAAEMKQEPRGL